MQQFQRRRVARVFNSALVITSLAAVTLTAARVSAQSRLRVGQSDGTGFTNVTGAVVLHSTVVVKPGVFQMNPPASTLRAAPFRPLLGNKALDWATYNGIKQQIARNRTARPDSTDSLGGSLFPPPVSDPDVAALGKEHAGGLNLLTSGDMFVPSDSILAVANKTAVEETNDEIGFYNKTPNTQPTPTSVTLKLSSSMSGDSFVGTGSGINAYDPQVVYDYYGTTAHPTGHYFAAFNSDSFGTGTGYHQYFYIGVNTSSADTLPMTFTIYKIDLPAIGPPPSTLGGKTTSDYVHVGYDATNVYLTSDFFDNSSGSYLGASIVIINKDQIENGTASPSTAIANGLNGHLMPPVVRQAGATGTAYFVYSEPFSTDAGNPSDSDIGLYSVTGTPPSAVTVTGPKQVAVPYYDYPPSAQQPGTFYTLDTLDSRFQSQSTQVGSHLYAVHCVDSAGLPTVRWYEVDGHALFAGTTPVLLNGTPHDVYAAATSNDFDPSIAASDVENIVITWNETLVARSGPTSQESVWSTSWEAGETATEPTEVWGKTNQTGKLVTGSISPDYSFEGRNGDYSATVVDPSNQLIFWGVAQNQLDSTHINWNTWLYDTIFPSPSP